MKKKILSVILCVVMLASTLAMTVGATAVNDTTAVWNTKWSALFNINVSGSRPVMFTLATDAEPIDENSTVTFWIKPNGWSAKQGGTAFQLISGSNFTQSAGSNTGSFGTANVLATLNTNIYGGLGLWLGFGGPGAPTNKYSLSDNEWNRVDMTVDFETKQLTAYVNYTLIGSTAFSGEFDNFTGLYMPNMNSQFKSAYMDNLMVRSGCNVPVKGDVASNPTNVVAGQNNVIMYQGFESATWTYDGSVVGGVCCNNTGDMLLKNTDGIVSQAQGAVNRGYQQSVAVADATDSNKMKYNTRFVATLDDYTKYDEIGFKLTVNGKESYVPCGAVYDSVTGGFAITETYSALGSFGAGYIYCLTVTGMEEGTSYAVEVAPYTVAKGQTDKVVGASYTVTLTAGASAQ